MRFAIDIQGAPHASQASHTALRFVRAALERGHEIRRVFFFHDGVLSGNAAIGASGQRSSPAAEWAELAQTAGFELAVCVTAALGRGIADEAERARLGLSAATLDPAFRLVGLGQLIEAASDCDRLITFAP